jgi:DNA-binding NtrC family response regulator
MSGLALLARLREFLPGLPAVIMSGFMSHHAGIAQTREETGAAYVGKPVDVDELIRTLGRFFPVRSAPAAKKSAKPRPAPRRSGKNRP